MYTMQHGAMGTYNELKYTRWTAMVQDDTVMMQNDPIMGSFDVRMVKHNRSL